MNIADKQRLWTKYYLTELGSRDSLHSLVTFARLEAAALKASPEVTRQRARKVVRYMLKYLSKDQIIKRYGSGRGHLVKINPQTGSSKNQIVNRLLRII